MVMRALKGEAITVYGAGEQIRDYVYVEDVARAFLLAAAEIDVLNGGHFIVSSGDGRSIGSAMQTVAERVRIRTGRSVEVLNTSPPGELSAIESRNFIGDTRRLRYATGWTPTFTLEEGLDATIEAMWKADGF